MAKKKQMKLNTSMSKKTDFESALNKSKLSVHATVVLVCGFFSIVLLFAPRENLLIIESIFEIIIIKGLGGAFYELKSSVDLAITTLYADFSVHKLVVFVVFVQFIPWIADTIVKLMTESPK